MRQKKCYFKLFFFCVFAIHHIEKKNKFNLFIHSASVNLILLIEIIYKWILMLFSQNTVGTMQWIVRKRSGWFYLWSAYQKKNMVNDNNLVRNDLTALQVKWIIWTFCGRDVDAQQVSGSVNGIFKLLWMLYELTKIVTHEKQNTARLLLCNELYFPRYPKRHIQKNIYMSVNHEQMKERPGWIFIHTKWIMFLLHKLWIEYEIDWCFAIVN